MLMGLFSPLSKLDSLYDLGMRLSPILDVFLSFSREQRGIPQNMASRRRPVLERETTQGESIT